MQCKIDEWVARSRLPEIRIPEVALHDFALRCAGALADTPALSDGPTGRALSYGQLARQVVRLRQGRRRQRVRPARVAALPA